eukprot:2196506-Prymnesium_polylepis.2
MLTLRCPYRAAKRHLGMGCPSSNSWPTVVRPTLAQSTAVRSRSTELRPASSDAPTYHTLKNRRCDRTCCWDHLCPPISRRGPRWRSSLPAGTTSPLGAISPPYTAYARFCTPDAPLFWSR